MQYFDLIFDECKKLNTSLCDVFVEKQLFFISANISEIVYGLDNIVFVFCYYPERYEYGKIMFLKDVRLRIDHDKGREYSLNQLSSFFQNDCKFYQEGNNFLSPHDYIILIRETLDQFEINKNKEWERKFIRYRKSILPKW
jgi:hypothetical protein